MDLFTTSPELDNALVDPASWADEQGIHEQFKLAAEPTTRYVSWHRRASNPSGTSPDTTTSR